MTPTDTKHIVLDKNGSPKIGRANFKVECLILEHLAHGWSPEELKWQFPDLELAEIHAAFTYYYDHKAAMDEKMETDRARLQALEETAPAEDKTLRDKLKSRARELGFTIPSQR